MNILFRPSRPGDASQAADLIYSAGPEALTYAFTTKKHRPTDFISEAFKDGAGSLGYRNHVVAEVNDSLVGIGAFYNTNEFDRLSLEMGWQIFRFYGVFKSWGVLKRSGRLGTLTPYPEKNALFFQNIAVAAEMQGMGIGKALIHYGIETARRQNLKLCLLDVVITNTRASALYEKFGFRIVETRKFPFNDDAVHVPGQSRMVLKL